MNDLQQQHIRNPVFFFKAESIRGCTYPGEPLIAIRGHSFPCQARMATDRSTLQVQNFSTNQEALTKGTYLPKHLRNVIDVGCP